MLSEDALPTQVIQINNNRDTTIKTANGAILQIAKGSFSGSDGVTLNIKEAYSMEAIISGGLTTESNGSPLSSGGMIYLNTQQSGVSFVKPIKVSLPTTSFDVAMKLFKGEKQDGKMNWKDPSPLKDSLQDYLNTGKAIFMANCRACHALDKVLTGPAMRGLESRGPWGSRSQLYAFTRNPSGYIPRTCYTKNLAATFGQIMPSFPQLNDEDLKQVYDYIRHQDIADGVDLTNTNKSSPCDDSCYRYDSVRFRLEDKIAQLNREKETLIDSNESRVTYERLDTFSNNPPALPQTNSVKPPKLTSINTTVPRWVDKVQPTNYKAVYYTFEITSLGWYNIDKLVDLPANDYIDLKVHVDDSLSTEWTVYIAVPEHKIFAEGGLLNNGTDYGFYSKDGKTPLPAGTEAIVLVVGEVNGKVAFDYSKFITSATNQVNLHPQLSTKEAFTTAMKNFVLPGININVKDAKHADEMRKVEAIIKTSTETIEAFRPKFCDCNCSQQLTDTSKATSPSGDSTAKY